MTSLSTHNFCFINEYLNTGDSHLYFKHNSVDYLVDDYVLDTICYNHIYSTRLYNRLFNTEMLILYMYLFLYILMGYSFVSMCYHLNTTNSIAYHKLKTESTNSSDTDSSDTDSNDSETSDSKTNKVNQYLHNVFIQQFVSSSKTNIFYYLYPESGLKKIVSYYLFDTDSTIEDNNESVDAKEIYNQIQETLGDKYFCHNPDNVKLYPITYTFNDQELDHYTSFNELHFIYWLHQTEIYHHVTSNRDRLLLEMKENNYITEEEFDKYSNFPLVINN